MLRARQLGRCGLLGLVIALGLALPRPADAQQTIGGCAVLPPDNIWNTPVDTLPVLSNSGAMVTTIGANTGLHPDFGAGLSDGGPIGIPFITVPGTQTKFPATFTFADESDPGPYAIPLNVPIEGGADSDGDRHAMAIDVGHCVLYEMFRAFPQASSWVADAGAIFDLKSNALRPSGWTSADAAGLPIVPGLVTFEEVQSGEIKHAIRFTAPQSRHAFVWPARHFASSLTGTQYPRMGERFRLKASFDVTPFPPEVQVILRAMKKYGIMLADNGSSWFISGKPDSRWNDSNLHALTQVLGSNFEAVDAASLMIDPNSGAAMQNGVKVSVSPGSATLHVGHTQRFTATVTGAPAGVTWSVNNIAGGDPSVGTIDTSGEYTAPMDTPSPSTVTIGAASTTSPTASGSASVAVLPLPTITSVSPSPITVGSFTLTVNGVGFNAGSVISFGGTALPTTFVSSTRVTGTGNAPSVRSAVPVAVNTPDGEVTNTVTVNVVAAPAVTITIAPTSATVRLRQTRQFTATVTNTSNKSVIWKVNGVVSGNSTVGTISTSGLYRAPNSVPNPAGVTVSATAAADQTKTASASVTVSRR
jgi:hypothetical protein